MRTIIVDLAPKDVIKEDLDDRLSELENLVNTYGSLVVVKKVQRKDFPDYKTFIGSGKLEEIRILADELNVELIIIGNILKPAQIFNINTYLRKNKSKAQAWDRVDLILNIFDLHTVTPEAKLQIELAKIKHMGPSIFHMGGQELSKQGAGIGTRGRGETNIEIMKRHLREKEYKILERLKVYKKTRSEHRKSRKRQDFKTIGVVGYTNAGKSSLMNVLTKKGVLSEDKLFATLGTSVGKVFIDDGNLGQEFLVNDTIGFIRDLPPELIKAFLSTLEDSIESDLLLHVVDASSYKIEERINIVDNILSKIEAVQSRIYVFNKTDLLTFEQIEELKIKFNHLNPVFISAEEKIGIKELKERIFKELNRESLSNF
ncbi:MAG: GTPase HflX [Candidatus Gracilibacteria bacterium]|nr:GTPase HflX [Candidatus Gracilibacteria bacterium]MDD3120080.1 GTPase HflX [Candidatus Gracilibacteria bacterium]